MSLIPTEAPPRVRYYRMGGGNVARVQNQEYSYLEHSTGRWVPHPAVMDAVTGYRGDAETREISEKQAQALIRRYTGKAGKRAGRESGNP